METYNTRPAFLEPFAMWNRKPKSANQLLYEAVIDNNTVNAARAIEMGADPNYKTEDGIPLVHYAAGHRNLTMLDMFHRWGADLDAVDGQNATALHNCAEYPEYVSTARWLLEIGNVADKVRDMYSRTPMHIALARENTPMIELLNQLCG